MLNRLIRMKKYLIMIADIFLICGGYLLAAILFADIYSGFVWDAHHFLVNLYVAVIVYLLVFVFLRMYNVILRFLSMRDYAACFAACCISGGILCIAKTWIPFLLPYEIHMLAGLFIGMLTVAMRAAYQVVRRVRIHYHRAKEGGKPTRTLIIGAGEAGSNFIREISELPEGNLLPVGVVDDDPAKRNCSLHGVKILGSCADIVRLCREKNIDMLVLAIPSIASKEKKHILELCAKTRCRVKVLPGLNDLIRSKSLYQNLHEVDIGDLLARDVVNLNAESLDELLGGKTVLVTGGGGSIGSELCRQIARFQPKLLVILDVYENNAYDLENELRYDFPSLPLCTVIASVRDRVRLEQIFAHYRPEVVFHAAAHKHVPLMENNPQEAIKNNVFGTLNSAECADKYGVHKFILISTDKAVNPTNVMGASKRLCEMIVQGINKNSATDYALVRFGNVLGSNGSVIPLFKRQIARGGPVTVTDKEITRYFMTIPEAAQLVLQAAARANGGEIFVLDMGEPVKIYEMARNIIELSGLVPDRDIEIKITGLRPGEKLYEELLLAEEGVRSTEDEKIYIANPLDIDIDVLKEELEELRNVASAGDDWRVKEILHRMVPTYQIDYSCKKTEVSDKQADVSKGQTEVSDGHAEVSGRCIPERAVNA